MAKRMTELTVSKMLPPKSGVIEVADAAVAGLTLRVGAGGKKTWELRCRIAGQKNPVRRFVGDARTMSLTDVHTAAKDMREKMLSGVDPGQEERVLWEHVAEDFIEKHAKPRNRSWRQTETILAAKVTPSWRGKRVNNITPDDVTTLLNRIEDDVSIYVANRTLAAIRKLFNWARMRGMIKASPVAPGLARSGEIQRDRALGFDEVAAVWSAAERIGVPFGPYVKLLLLTGQRRGETAAARWSGMDLEGEHVWRLTAAETKGKRDHPVPLSPAALELVKSQPKIADPDAAEAARKAGKDEPPPVYVFTTTGKSPLAGFSKAKRDLDKELTAAGVKLAPWRLHDLRRTVATHMESALGFPFYTVAMVLNHAPAGFKGVTSRYLADDLVYERRQALTAWARLLALIVAGGATRAKVDAILKPRTDEDRGKLAEFRRFIQSDGVTWDRYVQGLTQDQSSNVRELRPAVA